MRKIVSIFLFGVIGITFFSIILTIKKDKISDKCLSVLAMNSFIYQENKNFKVPFYLNTRVSSFTTKNQIDYAYISNEADLYLEINLLDIMENGVHSYNHQKYYGFIAKFSLPDVLISTDNAHIILFSLNQSLDIKIGSFEIKFEENVDSEDDLMISELFGIMDKNLETPCGIVLKLYNKTNETIKVNNVFLGNNVHISGNDIKYLDDRPISSLDDINLLLGYKYDIYGEYEKNLEIVIAPYAEVRVLLPLKYNLKRFFYQSPVYVLYDDKKMIMNNFIFYNSQFYLNDLLKVVVSNDFIS